MIKKRAKLFKAAALGLSILLPSLSHTQAAEYTPTHSDLIKTRLLPASHIGGHYDFCFSTLKDQQIGSDLRKYWSKLCNSRHMGPLTNFDIKQLPIIQTYFDEMMELADKGDLSLDTDAAIFDGREEHWLPIGMIGRGDCEDVAMQVMLDLNAGGVPMHQMGVAVVRQTNGEGHAVALLHTTAGTYVIDILDRQIKHFRDTNYTYLKIQSRRNMGVWKEVASDHQPKTVKSHSSIGAYLDHFIIK